MDPKGKNCPPRIMKCYFTLGQFSPKNKKKFKVLLLIVTFYQKSYIRLFIEFQRFIVFKKNCQLRDRIKALKLRRSVPIAECRSRNESATVDEQGYVLFNYAAVDEAQ